jgi:iron-sulfur cluster repair protein YtfE (RIC family)
VVADAEGIHSFRLIGFLRHKLLPHMRSEEDRLYPLVDAFMTRYDMSVGGTMTIEHQFVERQISSIEERIKAARLHRARDPEPRNVRQGLELLLVELDAILRLPLRKEEHVYLSVLRHYAGDEVGSEMRRGIQHVYGECDANFVSKGAAL